MCKRHKAVLGGLGSWPPWTMDDLSPVYRDMLIGESAEQPGEELSSDEWLME